MYHFTLWISIFLESIEHYFMRVWKSDIGKRHKSGVLVSKYDWINPNEIKWIKQ